MRIGEFSMFTNVYKYIENSTASNVFSFDLYNDTTRINNNFATISLSDRR